MQTLRKLPTQGPRSRAPRSRIGSTPTRHLVEQDTRRHGHVERLGALGQGDRHALRGDGVELRADSRPLVSDNDGDGSPSRPASPVLRPQGAGEGNAVRRRGPERHVVLPRPRDETAVVERYDRVAEGSPHGRPQGLGARRVGGAPQYDRAGGAQRVGRTDQRAHVTGILDAVDHERYRPRRRRELARGPAPRLDDGDDPLRRLGVGGLREGARADLLHPHGVPLQLRDERRAARRACKVGGDEGPFERNSGGERLLDEPYALDQGEPAPAARLAALEITYRRLQITGDESPRAFSAAAEHSIRSEEHTSELQSQSNLVCRLLLEKKKRATPPASVITRTTRAATALQDPSVSRPSCNGLHPLTLRDGPAVLLRSVQPAPRLAPADG